MRISTCTAVLVVLAGYAAAAEEPNAIELSKQVLLRETVRLNTVVEEKKDSMSSVRMTRVGGLRFRYSIAGIERTIAAYNLILKQGQPELLVTSCQAIVCGDLERNYESQHWKREDKQTIAALRKQENALLAELKVLNGWHNKAIDIDKK